MSDLDLTGCMHSVADIKLVPEGTLAFQIYKILVDLDIFLQACMLPREVDLVLMFIYNW